MGIGYILLWLVGLSNLSLIIRAFRLHARRNIGWIIAAATVLLITATVAVVTQSLELAGWAGGALWLVFILLPGAGGKSVERACGRSDFSTAYRYAFWLRLVHPADGYVQVPVLLKAIVQHQKGRTTTTGELLRRVGKIDNPLPRSILAQWFVATGSWEEFVEWAMRQGGSSEMRQDPRLFAQYLRALGETGQLPELVIAARDALPLLHDAGTASIATCRLFLFAFCGERAALENLLAGPLKNIPTPARLFWLTTADLAAGRLEATETLQMLTSSDDARVRKSADRRMLHPPAIAAEQLSAQLQQEVRSQVAEAELDYRHLVPAQKIVRRPWVTYVLIGLNVLVFLGEIANGANQSEEALQEALYKMGALIPELVMNGEYWRMIASMFLHAGTLHLFMNMFALRLVGPFIEFAVGGPQFLFLYMATGLLSMGTVTYLSLHGIVKSDFLVGASGAIMGLIGAAGAIFFRVWRTERSPAAYRRLTSIGFALLIQVAFDLSTPQVSFSAHLSGVIWGFAIGMVLRHNMTHRSLKTLRG